MEDRKEEAVEEKEVIEEEKEHRFDNLAARRKYFQENPEIFPKIVQDLLLLRPPYKEGISYFAYNLAKDVETRHDAHWQLQTYMLMDISKKLGELVSLMGEGKKERKTLKL